MEERKYCVQMEAKEVWKRSRLFIGPSLLLVYQARLSLTFQRWSAWLNIESIIDYPCYMHCYLCSYYVDVFQHPEVKKWAEELKSLRNEHSKQTA